MKPYIIAAVLALSALACKKTTEPPPPPPSITAQWEGSVNVGGSYTKTFSMLIKLSGQSVSGSGSLKNSADGRSAAMTVSGTFISPDISLTLRPSGPAINFTGSVVSATVMQGQLNGGDKGEFAGQAITFIRTE